jgi:hypothetical protein
MTTAERRDQVEMFSMTADSGQPVRQLKLAKRYSFDKIKNLLDEGLRIPFWWAPLNFDPLRPMIGMIMNWKMFEMQS